MAKRKASAAKPERRPRGEIDRNYFFGDVFIKTGAALGVVVAIIAAYTPMTVESALAGGMYDYLAVMGSFAGVAAVCFLFGRHLRRQATHWDFD
ncbi:MAG TPA: hypothetical protein VEA80_01860 [Vitreimonas sp.]|uniref:hypothetical protein n=1 Tax=Vitreimonas sp. TaxID=3069702 RepID=UPI002D6BD418|nr:hypothetical protein [Vitreimonas sp.]HYD86196.1 hypothetical protein [Vitreimonas sp.]